jgi:hypothetical protein
MVYPDLMRLFHRNLQSIIYNPHLADYLFRRVSRTIPSICVLLPPKSGGQPNDFLSWRFVGCKSLLDDGIKSMLDIRVRSRERVPFEIRELMRLDEAWYMPDGLSLAEVFEFANDGIITWFNDLYQKNFSVYPFTFIHLLRQINEHISGQVQNHCTESSAVITKEIRSITRRLRQAEFMIPDQLKSELKKDDTILFLSQKSKHAYLKLRKGIITNNGLFPKKLSSFDIVGQFTDINPFQKYIGDLVNSFESEMRGLLKDKSEADELARDREFMQLLEKRKVLRGRGEFRNVQIEMYRSVRDGCQYLKLSMSLGNRPFLMQMYSSPVFTFWDLKAYPIRVVLEKKLEYPNESIPLESLTHLIYQAESAHHSICRHPFVRASGIVNGCYRGAICMEETHLRLFSLHHRQAKFDAVIYILQVMSAAARILRNGVRYRDRSVSQHNPYVRVKNPESLYQAVVKGWPQVQALARKHNAEIIRYVR